MKTIYKIARTELRTLFFSPVAWLILVIFAFQIAMVFTGIFTYLVKNQAQGYELQNITLRVFAGRGAIFESVQQYLYFYIPLLTMGLMSREYSGGTIKLLYSSPVTNLQIILGKFLSMVFYAMALIGILMMFGIFCAATIDQVDFPAILSGMLGIFLMVCAYAAIGLFMSTLTSYQVVAAIGTLAVLFFLNLIGSIGQDMEFIRDLTYWLSIKGRADQFIMGLICSEDILYFLIVIALFLSYSTLKLQSERQKCSFGNMSSKYILVTCCALLLGYLSSRPKLMSFCDTTRTESCTLSKNSRAIVEKMKGGLTITAYSNLLERNYWFTLPKYINEDKDRFRQYLRFKPETKMRYVYYYDEAVNESLDERYPDLSLREKAEKVAEINELDMKMFLTPEQIRAKIDLSSESNRMVRLVERESGEKTFLRVFDDMMRNPTEAEISAAFKRLVMRLPNVGFLCGHGERDNKRRGDRDYRYFAQDKPFRYSLINQGFDICDVQLDALIPESVDILVIADMKDPLTDEEEQRLDQYIERGGNLLIAGEPRRIDQMNQLVNKFGVRFTDGALNTHNENFQPDFIFSIPTPQATQLSYIFADMHAFEAGVTMPGCCGLLISDSTQYHAEPLFVTDTSECWNEVETSDFIDEKPVFNPAAGEKMQRYTTALALTKKFGDKEQRVFILGDADCISNGEISIQRKSINAQNFSIVKGAFYWLSNNEVPVDISRPIPPDRKVFLTEKSMHVWKIIFMWIIPTLLIAASLVLWLRRKSR